MLTFWPDTKTSYRDDKDRKPEPTRIRRTALIHYEMTVAMLNDSMRLCLRWRGSTSGAVSSMAFGGFHNQKAMPWHFTRLNSAQLRCVFDRNRSPELALPVILESGSIGGHFEGLETNQRPIRTLRIDGTACGWELTSPLWDQCWETLVAYQHQISNTKLPINLDTGQFTLA